MITAKPSKLDPELVAFLRRWKDRPAYPCIQIKVHGQPFLQEGRHRQEADPNWPTIELDFKTRSEAAAFYLSLHHGRRRVNEDEKRLLVNMIAEDLEDQGVPLHKIANAVASATGLDINAVRCLLADEFKYTPRQIAAKERWKREREQLLHVAQMQSAPPSTPIDSTSRELESVVQLPCEAIATARALKPGPKASIADVHGRIKKADVRCPVCRSKIRSVRQVIRVLRFLERHRLLDTLLPQMHKTFQLCRRILS